MFVKTLFKNAQKFCGAVHFLYDLDLREKIKIFKLPNAEARYNYKGFTKESCTYLKVKLYKND